MAAASLNEKSEVGGSIPKCRILARWGMFFRCLKMARGSFARVKKCGRDCGTPSDFRIIKSIDHAP